MWRILHIGLLLLALTPQTANSQPTPEVKRVLILNAYNEGYHWTDRTMEGIKSVFDAEDDVEIFVTYMDTKRCSDEEYFSQLHDLYAHKYRFVKFDAIVSSDDHALDFLLKYRDDLFPRVPVFFCGINDFHSDRIAGHDLYTGVYETYDVPGTIDLMLRLHPGTKKIAAITDGTVSGRAFFDRIKRAEPDFVGRVEIEYLDNLGRLEFERELGRLSDDTLVLWAIYMRSPEGQSLSSEESVRMTTRIGGRPTYCIWDVVGHGVVGGKITSPNFQGAAAAGMALKHLRGTPFAELQISGSPMVHLFDYEVMKNLDIDKDALPTDSIIYNRPYSAYRQYRKAIWVALGFMVGLLGVIVALAYHMRKHAQVRKALSTSEERLQLALTGANDGLWDWHVPDNTTYFSDRYYTMAGYKPNAFSPCYEEWARRVHPDDLSSTEENIKAGHEKLNGDYDTEFRFLRGDDSWMWIRARGKVVDRDQNGAPVRMVGTHSDITAHKQVEEKLLDSMGRLEAISNSVPDTILLSDRDGNISYINRLLSGMTREQVYSTKVFDFVPEEQRSTVINALKTVFEDARPVTYEATGPGPDGTELSYYVRVAPVFSGNAVSAAVFLATDITDRKHAEEEQTKRQKLESIGTLAGGIAHDFNNLLTGLFGNISLASDELEPGHKAALPLTDAQQAMDRAIQLTNQLLTFARGGEPVREILDVGKLVKESVRFDLAGTNLKPVIECPDDLLLVNADRGQIHQVISNLAINANQAMPEGGCLQIVLVNVELKHHEVAALQAGQYVRITVRDEGEGIDPTIVGRIFDPYFTTKTGGSGLGLATNYSIMSRHNGHIGVESKLKEGSVFTLYLPASDVQELPNTVHQKNESSDTPLSGRILVMDDEQLIRDLVQAMLSKRGYSADAVVDGQEAIKAYELALNNNTPYDAVIMDLTIPGAMGGQEAVRAILKINPQARCIVSSGYANDPICANFKDYGFKGVIEKPYSRQRLDEVLIQVLGE